MEHFLIHYGYGALFLVTAISALGIPIGSEIVTGFAGALASSGFFPHHHLSLAAVILVAFAGELVGSACGYLIGRLGGRRFVDRFGRYLLLTHKDLDRVERLFSRRGDSVVLIGKLVPLLRSFISIASGLAEMRIVNVATFTVLGCGIWCVGISCLGDALGANWHQVIGGFSDAGYVFAGLAVLTVLVAIAHRVHTLRAERTLAAEVTSDASPH